MKFNFTKQKHISICNNFFLNIFFNEMEKKILDDKQGILELKSWFWKMCILILNQYISKIVFSSIWFFFVWKYFKKSKLWFIPALYNFVRDQFNKIGIDDSISIFSNLSLLLLFRFIFRLEIVEKQLFGFFFDNLFVFFMRG